MTSEIAIEMIEKVLAPYFSGNRQPCMSGDPRDRLSPLRLRDCQEAARAVIEITARPIEAGSVVDLIRNALQFSVWAAGEGLTPQESHIASPEDFLCDYSTETGDEDWDGLPNRVAAAIAERDERIRRAEGALHVIKDAHPGMGTDYLQGLARAALQQEGESDV